jgi:PAS domain S-box-containing protein
MERVGETLRSRVLSLMASSPSQLAHLKAADIRMLVQELDTHQVELEQQNEELRLAQLALAQSRDRLSDLYEFAPLGYVTLDVRGTVRAANLAGAELLGVPRQKLLGRRFSGFVAAVDVGVFTRCIDETLTGQNKVQCEVGLPRAEGALRLRLESIRLPASDPDAGGGPVCQVALIDITQASIAKALMLDLNRGLEMAVAERTRELSESLVQRRAQEDRLALALDAGVMSAWTLDLEVGRPRGGSDLPTAPVDMPEGASHSKTSWLRSLHPDDRERISAITARAIDGAHPVIAAEYRVLLPDGKTRWFAVRGRVMLDTRRRPCRIVGVEQDIDERKRLEMEVLQIADRAQRRIGQELHDDIQQRLTGLGLLAESLCDSLRQRSAPEEKLCRRLTVGIEETGGRVNRLSHGLVPLELEGGGLVVALHRLACATDAPGRVQCTFRHDAPLSVADGFSATHLYRIAQEAVTNALRHSGAANIHISLARNAAGATLEVSDDGAGMRHRGEDGRGLHIMAYRASLIGAILRITNSKSRGTCVSCTFGATGMTEGTSKNV